MYKREPCVYILASGRNGWLYVGVTSNLLRRVHEHREGIIPGWASKMGAVHLVRYEFYDSMEQAISREKAVKKYRRSWKLRLIESENPNWDDLYEKMTGADGP